MNIMQVHNIEAALMEPTVVCFKKRITMLINKDQRLRLPITSGDCITYNWLFQHIAFDDILYAKVLDVNVRYDPMKATKTDFYVQGALFNHPGFSLYHSERFHAHNAFYVPKHLNLRASIWHHIRSSDVIFCCSLITTGLKEDDTIKLYDKLYNQVVKSSSITADLVFEVTASLYQPNCVEFGVDVAALSDNLLKSDYRYAQ